MYIQILSKLFSVPLNNMIMPGEHANVRITLLRKMVMTRGQAFTLRENGATVATGMILERKPSIELPKNKLSKAIVSND